MKRREFLSHTAGVAGVLVARVSTAQVRPCPPPLEGQVANCTDGGAPSWFLNAADEEWFVVPSSNTGSDIGMTNGMWANFTGAGMNQERLEFTKTCCGGHQVGWQNMTVIFELNTESPKFVRLVDNTPLELVTPGAGGADANMGDQTYLDGSPRAAHNWNANCWPIGDSIWLSSLTGMYTYGGNDTMVWELDRGSITNPPVPASGSLWTSHGRGVDEGSYERNASLYLQEAAVAARDYDTGLIWNSVQKSLGGWYPFWSVDTANGDVTQYPEFGGVFPDIRRGSSFIVDSYWIFCNTGGTVRILDLRDPTFSNFKVITSTGSFSGSMDAVGASYDSKTRRAYFYRASLGNTINTLDVPEDPWNDSWTKGGFTASGVTPTGTGSDYGHFQIIHDMGNGQSALIWIGNAEIPYMYKLR